MVVCVWLFAARTFLSGELQRVFGGAETAALRFLVRAMDLTIVVACTAIGRWIDGTIHDIQRPTGLNATKSPSQSTHRNPVKRNAC
jgi:hypothetical protein